MSHINHQICTAGVSDLSELLEVDDPGISACAADDHFRLTLHYLLIYLIVVDNMCYGVNAV